MKKQTNIITTSGTIDHSDSKKMGVSAKGMGALMSILSNMYEDSYEAVLREYAANGFDSHVQAGQTRPVDVTLPSEWQPSLLIRDYGVGMTLETMENVYAEYLTSTKEETDDQVGGFGIGAKSAFTLGQQFIVTGIKDGQKSVVLFSLDEDNVGETTVMYEGPTEEPQGVQVSLAVEDVERMCETAVRVFRTWAPGTVLVDGVAPASVFTGAHTINETTVFVPESIGKVYAVLGPIAYPINGKILRETSKHLAAEGHESAALVANTLSYWSNSITTDVYFLANIGDMTIAPNREGLRDTKKTIASLSSLVLALSQDTVESVQGKVDAARSSYEAARILRQQRDLIAPLKVSRKDLTFDGRPLQKSSTLVKMHNYVMGTKNWRSTTMVVQDHPSVEFEIEAAEKSVVITGVSEKDTGKVRRFARRFLEETNYDRVFVTDADAASYGWFTFGVDDGVPTLTLDEYRTVLRGFRTTSPRLVNEPSYMVGVGVSASRDLDDRTLLSDIINEGLDIVVCHGNSPAGPLAEEALKDYTVVVLLATQSEASLRKRVAEDGNVEVLDRGSRSLIHEIAQAKFDTITPTEKDALGAVKWLSDNNKGTSGYNTWMAFARALGAEHFPEIAEINDAYALAELVAADITDVRRSSLSQVARFLGHSHNDNQYPTFDYEIPQFERAYPLISQINSSTLCPASRWSYREAVRNDALAYLESKRDN